MQSTSFDRGGGMLHEEWACIHRLCRAGSVSTTMRSKNAKGSRCASAVSPSPFRLGGSCGVLTTEEIPMSASVSQTTAAEARKALSRRVIAS